MTYPEPFGPLYEAPPGNPCPGCECCTERLCKKAIFDNVVCVNISDDRARVSGCPCTRVNIADLSKEKTA
jgi:hypothetical protein